MHDFNVDQSSSEALTTWDAENTGNFIMISFLYLSSVISDKNIFIGMMNPGCFGLGRFGQFLGWVLSAKVGEWFRSNFNRDRGSIW